MRRETRRRWSARPSTCCFSPRSRRCIRRLLDGRQRLVGRGAARRERRPGPSTACDGGPELFNIVQPDLRSLAEGRAAVCGDRSDGSRPRCPGAPGVADTIRDMRPGDVLAQQLSVERGAQASAQSASSSASGRGCDQARVADVDSIEKLMRRMADGVESITWSSSIRSVPRARRFSIATFCSPPPFDWAGPG